ncbi:MAG TPA: aminodeoxychorismate lyase, partial [Methylophilaceae bacterium]|nr:aminodeoxychorismate lyase [Methylophilaceae bacterium]
MRFLRRLMLTVILGAILFIGWMVYFANAPIKLTESTVEVDLKAGSSLRSVAQQLVEQGVLHEPWSFVLLVRFFGRASEVKA